MPADDRDLKFERALAQHLRAGSAASCPDAEILAAYHERSLSLEELAYWKQHIASCAACQEALALVEATEKEFAEEWKEKNAPVLHAAAMASETRSHATADRGVDAPAGDLPTAAAPVSMARRRPTLVRWALPLGAVAAGVLIWIGIHEQRALRHGMSPAAIQVAQNQPTTPPALEQKTKVAPPAAAARDDKQAQLDDETVSRQAQSLQQTPRVTPSSSTTRQSTKAKDAGSLKKEVIGEGSGGGVGAGAALDVAATPAPSGVPTPAPPKVPAVTQTVEVTNAAPPVETSQTEADKIGATGGAGSVVPQIAGTENKPVAQLHQEKAEPSQANGADVNTNAMMMKQGVNGRSYTALTAMAPGPQVILTPDNRVWWRLSSGGAVMLTSDGGNTWKTSDTGANGTLTAGSAPSSNVCWLAGKSGTLVLTTDRGAHWSKIVSPISGDLGGVHASDEKHASIWAVSNKVSFETNDGGATWKQIANE